MRRSGALRDALGRSRTPWGALWRSGTPWGALGRPGPLQKSAPPPSRSPKSLPEALLEHFWPFFLSIIILCISEPGCSQRALQKGSSPAGAQKAHQKPFWSISGPSFGQPLFVYGFFSQAGPKGHSRRGIPSRNLKSSPEAILEHLISLLLRFVDVTIR